MLGPASMLWDCDCKAGETSFRFEEGRNELAIHNLRGGKGLSLMPLIPVLLFAAGDHRLLVGKQNRVVEIRIELN